MKIKHNYFNKKIYNTIIYLISLKVSKISFFVLFTFYFSLRTSTPAQVVYEDRHNEIYSFLDRLSQKGVIDYNNLIKPISRIYIAEKLNKLQNRKNQLSSLELAELNFFYKEFGIEILQLADTSKVVPKMSLFEFDRYNRFRMFSFESNFFSLLAKPIFGYEYSSLENGSNLHRWNGIRFYGYIGNHIGFEFSFRDNRESGDGLDSEKNFTPVTGITIARQDKEGFEYSDFMGSISYSWDWGTATIGKQQITWGYEQSGNIVLSNKTPSFPLIRLDIKPVDWFSFNYFHGWLNSDIEDTNLAYPTYIEGHNRQIYRDKFIASHTLILTPLKGLDFSLGESVIYSEKLQIAYLFPMMFFRAIDHYLHYPGNDFGDNSQFFFSLSSKNHLKNTHLFLTIFIDEIKIGDIFNSEKQRNQIGLNFGGSITDFLVNDLTLRIEYTRINPFAYIHYIPSLTYQSDSYNLGHWMGHNGNLLYFSLKYRILRGLQTKLWFQSISKGGEGTPVQQWDTSIPQPKFLFGLNTNYAYYGINVNYEFIHDLHLRVKYRYSSIKTEYEEGKFSKEGFSTFKLALYYGL